MTSTEIIPVDQVADVLLNGTDLGVVDENAMTQDMVQRILESETLEDAFSNFTSVPAKDIEGVLIDINGVAFARSAFEQGPAVYALLNAKRHDTGEDVVVSMGGRTLMAALVWAMRHRAMPFQGSFVQRKSNANPERSYWSFNLA